MGTETERARGAAPGSRDAGESRGFGPDDHRHHTTLGGLSPLRRARAELLLNLLRERGSFLVDAGRAARYVWSDRGLTLAQRDAALEDLVEAGLARLDSSGPFVIAERVRAAGEVTS